MTILAQFKNQPVEILDVYDMPNGKVASLRALQGKPFVAGDKWPVWSEWTTAPVAELTDIHPQPETKPNNPTLLDLALAQAKPQWYSGESVWVWRNGKRGAFLKAYTGEVCLHLTGYRPSLTVFVLTAQGWQAAHNLDRAYQTWAAKAREELQ